MGVIALDYGPVRRRRTSRDSCSFAILLPFAPSPSDLTDIETGLKMFRREAIQAITLNEERFGIEPGSPRRLPA